MPSAATPVRLPAGLGRALGRVRHLLPEGRTLPADVWRRRHRALLLLLWAHAIGLPLFALARGYTVPHSLVEGLPLAVIATLAMVAGQRRRTAAALVSIGLISSSAILVHIWGGVIEGHFHFFVMIVLLSLYEDWLPFLLAAAYVVIHHGLAGGLAPDSVYNHREAVAHPWRWAAIHGLFVTGAGIGAVAAWRLNEDVRAESRAAYRRARHSEERFKSAFENAPIGMVLASIHPADAGRFMQVNRAMCDITGYSEEQLLGRRLKDITHEEDLDGGGCLLERLLADGVSTLQAEKRYVRADGRDVAVLVNVSLVHDGSGDPVYAIAQVQDITERKRAQEELTFQAHHDPLTGLRNRRKLMEDLERRLSFATDQEPVLLALFDLDGFKAYNDTFGHPAGDALLSRLGRRLDAAVDSRGVAYRMGGDEFCVLSSLDVDGAEPLAAAAAAALSERGEGFTVTATYGVVVLPHDATDEEEALRKADQRMYARKGKRRASPGRQATDALLKALDERSHELGEHLHDVTDLCEAVARALEVPDEELTPLLQAAALHDVGKVAIPDAILNKPAALDPAEWDFIRAHTRIGERILAAAPALVDASKIVRSSHERFDGKGYPDGLAEAQIPLGARIIAVCDAYDAMTSNRHYRTAMSAEGALSELRRNAGAQFDPAVVEAFVAIAADDPRTLAR
ncbi:MAG: diguanylate cyclase [Actinomycetota bacterium]|nr:diguanylate cyclase [Actinomycetota bacterium]